MNVLKSHLRIAIETLLRGGATQREIERFTGAEQLERTFQFEQDFARAEKG